MKTVIVLFILDQEFTSAFKVYADTTLGLSQAKKDYDCELTNDPEQVGLFRIPFGEEISTDLGSMSATSGEMIGNENVKRIKYYNKENN